MAYGTIKVDNITFTNGGIDQTITVSGIVQSISGDITATGTIQANTISGVTGIYTSGVFASGTAGAPSVSIGTTSNGLYSPGTDQVAISTSGTGRLFVDSSGRVGIGTSSPDTILHVHNATAGTVTASTNAHLVVENSANTGINILTPSNQNGQILFGDPDDNDIGRIQYNHTSDYLALYTNANERLRIDSSGRVGIGTSSPVVPLDISYSSATGYPIQITNTNTTSTALNGLDLNLSNGASGAFFYVDSAVTGGSPYNVHIKRGQVTAAICFDSATGEHARIDASGRLLVGNSSARTQAGITAQIQLEGTSASTSSIQLIGNSNDSLGSFITLGKTRGTAAGGTTIVSDNDRLGELRFAGADGNGTQVPGAYIAAYVDGTPGTNDMPGRLVFSTTADGAATPTERLRIDSSGNVGIGTSAPSTLLHLSSATGTATPTPTELRIASTSNASDWSTTDPWGRISFYTADASSAGPKIEASIDAVAGFSTGGISNLVFQTAASSTGVLTPRMTVTYDGKVGIGTSSPDTILHVHNATAGTVTASTNAHLVVENSANTGINILTPSNQNGQILFGDPDDNDIGRIQYNHTSDYLALYTNANERLRIDSSGNVGIGTTAPGRSLEVYNSTQQIVARVRSGSAVSARIGLVDANTSDDSQCGIGSAGNALTLNAGGFERIRITSDGYVGINTGTPSAAGLTVARGSASIPAAGSSGSSGPAALFGNGVGLASYGLAVGATTAGLGYIQAQRADGTATTYNLTIQPNGGNVGIGTSAPNALLDISGTGATNNLCLTSTGNAVARLTASNTSGCFIQMGDPDDTDVGRIVYDNPTNVLYFVVNAAERARIDSSGRLLVGTTSARANFFNSTIPTQLQVEGTGLGTSAISSVRCSDDNGGAGIVIGKTRGTTVGSNTIVQANDVIGGLYYAGSDGSELVVSAAILSYVDGTPGANDMPGSLVFQTTADGSATLTERMRINNVGVTNTFSSSTNSFIARTSAAAGTANNLFAGFYGATNVSTGTVSFLVRSNGDVENTNNSYGAISDIKLKENIVDANSQWDDLKALQVRNYNFKEGQTHTQIGLVAQEVELVSPGLVSEAPDRDEDGNDLGTTTKSVNYSVLYMKAVKALQEAMERIEVLEAKVNALEGN